MLEQLILIVKQYLPFVLVLAGVIAVLFSARRVLYSRFGTDKGKSLIPLQLTLLALSAIGFVVVIMAFPMSDTTQGQVLSLLGVLLTGIIAFSSTTFVANIVAGLMLRSVETFNLGDFIRVDEQWGRVSERGLFHTEIQTEDRDLITFPNLYLATHPITVVRKSGTMVSSKLSLGYDVPHTKVEELMQRAAINAQLQDPFVHVNDLGDFSVTYRVSGFLTDVKQLLTVKSNLRKQILDTFHAASIEIVSPTFMNQRRLSPDEQHIPTTTQRSTRRAASSKAEDIVFDKAEKAEKLEQLRSQRHLLKDQLRLPREERADPGISDDSLQQQIDSLKRQIDSIKNTSD